MANVSTNYQPSPITANYPRSTPATSWHIASMPFLASFAISGVPVWPNFTFGEGVVEVSYSQDFDLYPALSPTTCLG